MKVLILGAGVVGSAVAYYLSLRGISATVIEAVGVANAASGKSGGFLAKDWCDGQPQERLAQFSFDLHADLARSLGRDYGYRRLTTLSVETSERRSFGGQGKPTGPGWIDGDCHVRGTLGDPSTTAQLDPALFTRALLDAALENGATLLLGSVSGVLLDRKRRRVEGVIAEGEGIDADAVVVAMGPWTQQAASWLPLPAVQGSLGCSIVVRANREIPPEALFVEYEDDRGQWHGPEIIPRADGSVYLCGFGDHSGVPESPGEVKVDGVACERLRSLAARISTTLGGSKILYRQACYRPICRDAMPVLGAVEGVSGAYVASGHNCWGMLNAPGSGYALAELIAEGRSSTLDLNPFSPSRFPSVQVAGR